MQTTKRAFLTSTSTEGLLELNICRFLLTLLADYQKRSSDFLTNKLSISTTFEKLSVPAGRIALAGLVLDQIWSVTIQKEFGL